MRFDLGGTLRSLKPQRPSGTLKRRAGEDLPWVADEPAIGGALFLADKILGDRVARFASVKYRVSGDWQQPTVEFDKAFDNEAALEE